MTMLKIIFPPLPDECIDGYATRICNANGKLQFSSESLFQELIASTGLQPSILIQHHTHLPYRRFIYPIYFGKKFTLHGDVFSNSAINRGLPIHNPRFCPSCIEEDLDFHGVSYWRRTHQLPGVYHCAKHAQPLIKSLSSDFQKRHPATSTKIGKEIEDNFLDEYFRSNSIQNFIALSEYAIHALESLKPSNVLQAIRKKVIEDHAGSLRSVHLLICRNFPHFWLHDNFPKFLENSDSTEWFKKYGLLNSTNRTYATKSYLLLMAILWQSPERAIRDCQPSSVHSRQETNLAMSEMALVDFISGSRIKDTCRKHRILIEDFEVYLRKFISTPHQKSPPRSEQPNSSQT